jgi:tryptophan synthase beta chain
VEGILPALEPAHAVAHLRKIGPVLTPEDLVVLNLSGRGDKDVETVQRLVNPTTE